MTQNHRLVGIIELSTVRNFKPTRDGVELEDQALSNTWESITLSGPLPETNLQADLAHLSSELEEECQQFLAGERTAS